LIKTNYDYTTDVLYVIYDGVIVVNSNEAPSDSELILNKDANGNVVGMQIIGMKCFLRQPHLWEHHPDIEDNVVNIPEDLFEAVINWIGGCDCSIDDDAMNAAEEIFNDLAGRSGIGTNQIDDEIKQEMLETWRNIIINKIT
jgi:uncharacterized protein YuzE